MTDETGSAIGALNPGSLAALQKLVDDLIRADVAGVDQSDISPLAAEFRIELQDLVSAEMIRSDRAPDLTVVFAAALAKWTSDK